MALCEKPLISKKVKYVQKQQSLSQGRRFLSLRKNGFLKTSASDENNDSLSKANHFRMETIVEKYMNAMIFKHENTYPSEII